MNKLVKFLNRNSSTILTGLSITSSISAVVFAVKETPKALILIEKKKKEQKEVTKRDIIKATWTCYIPSALCLASSAGFAIASNRIEVGKSAALASLLTASEQTLATFTAKTVEKIGEKKTSDIKDEVVKERMAAHPIGDVNGIFNTGKGDTIFYDTMRDKYFYHDIQSVRKVFNDLNYDLRSDMYLNLNDVYYALGLRQCEIGNTIGWNINYEGQIEYELRAVKMENEEPCLALIFHNYSTDYQNGYVR